MILSELIYIELPNFSLMIQDKIKLLRVSNKLTQAQLAEKLNMSPNAYNRLEKGKISIHTDKIIQIALCLKIEPSQLLDDHYLLEFGKLKETETPSNQNEKEREQFELLLNSKDKQIEGLIQQNQMLLDAFKKDDARRNENKQY